jgi:hypothetical protein
MATKPNLNEHVSLLFELYNRIPRLGKVTALELQKQLANIGLNRDIRTIQRNLNILVQHLSVELDSRDKPYGYHRGSLPVKTFGPRESMLLHLAEAWLTKSFPLEYKATINSIFSEIHNLKTQTNSHRKDSQSIFSEVKTDPLISEYSSKFNAIFEQLAYGIILHQVVYIDIGNQKQRIDPLGFSISRNKLFVIFRSSTNEYRHVEIENIQDVGLSTFNFEYPKNFNLSSYQKQGGLKSSLNGFEPASNYFNSMDRFLRND